MLLAKAGLLDDVKYTAGIWDKVSHYFDFIPEQNNLHQPFVHDKNIITAIVFAFREFEMETIWALGLDCGGNFFKPVSREYTREELIFKMGDADFAEFRKELERYEN